MSDSWSVLKSCLWILGIGYIGTLITESEYPIELGLLALLCLLYYLVRRHRKDREELFRDAERAQ